MRFPSSQMSVRMTAIGYVGPCGTVAELWGAGSGQHFRDGYRAVEQRLSALDGRPNPLAPRDCVEDLAGGLAGQVLEFNVVQHRASLSLRFAVLGKAVSSRRRRVLFRRR
jgi:hypothetical protein